MFASFRPTEVKEGDLLVVRGIRGQDFGDDVTPWGEHSFEPGTIIKVLRVYPPGSRSEAEHEREYAFYCEGYSRYGSKIMPNLQTLTADEIVGKFTSDPVTVEAILNAR